MLLKTGGLWLKLKGLEKCELVSSTITMPKGIDEHSATSLNHCYTLLSKAIETHRISNTGNVYRKVYYQDADNRWYPLDDLRNGIQAKAERKLLRSLWDDVEKMLGWRPVPPAPSTSNT